MPNTDPSTASGSSGSLLAVCALVLAALTAVGTLMAYRALHGLEAKVHELSDKVRVLEAKNPERDPVLSTLQTEVKEHADKLTDHEKRLTALAGKRPGATPPPDPNPPVVGSLDARVEALETKLKDNNGKLLENGLIAKAVQKVDILENKLKDGKGKLLADGEIAKSIQLGVTLEDKLKDATGKLIADGEIAKSIQKGVSLEKKLRDNRGNPLSDTAIGDAIRQVSLTKEDVNAINIRLATSRTQ